MDRTILWSPKAKRSYYQILEFLEQNWTQREIEIFINRTEEVLAHIITNPHIYPYSITSNTFKSVIVTQVSLFYRVNNNQIELLIFWSNKQNPSKLIL